MGTVQAEEAGERVTRDEQERFDDYISKSQRELAGMLISLEKSLDQKNRELSALRRGETPKKTSAQKALDKLTDRVLAKKKGS